MLVDRNSQTHLYIQIAECLRQSIESGQYPVGCMLPTEAELCEQFGVSRFPMRQAMALLVRDGWLARVRGKGTFVNDPAQAKAQTTEGESRASILALVLPGLGSDFLTDILSGFEQAATARGYGTLVASSDSAEGETAAIERMVRCGAAGIVIFPLDQSTIREEMLNSLIAQGVHVSIMDRNPGLDHIDYVGSDNNGGGYMAAYHMKQQGFRNVVFLSEQFHVSSVVERFAGFLRGVQQFGLHLLGEDEPVPEGARSARDYCFETFVSRLDSYRQHGPFAVFAENDYVAKLAYAALRQHGLTVGEGVGVIGFANSAYCDDMAPPLTSFAQNGFLIGDTAADLAIQKLETGSRQSVRHILPTQLVVRRSCGEGRMVQ